MPPANMTVLPPKAIQLDRDGKLPRMAIRVRVPHLGSYELALWNSTGTRGKVFRTGNTADRIADDFRIVNERANLPRLNNRSLTWVVWIQRTKAGSQDPWSFDLTLSQGDSALDTVAETGPMSADLIGFRGSYDLTVS